MLRIVDGAKKGKLVVLEGLDGSGKSLQFGLLRDYLQQHGVPVITVDFPNYEGSVFGKIVGQYLNGDLGDVYEVSPYVSAFFYAGDRLEAQATIADYLNAGKIVLANRFVGSNMAYQSAKLPVEERQEFIGWLKRLEYEANRQPREDLVLYLNAPVATSQKLVGQKKERSYTNLSHDIHERNRNFLEEVSGQYLELCATEPNWQQLDVTNAAGEMLAPEVIQGKILEILVQKNILSS